MKLVLQTKVIARTMDAKYIEWANRKYEMPLITMDFMDIDAIERQVHRWACNNEKHRLNFHETVDTWYIVPEV
jgi:hypothetical protein